MTQRGKTSPGSQRSRKTKSARRVRTGGPVVRGDSAMTESQKNRIVFEATDRFLKSGVEIKDVYRKLSD
jgi:hypothetical protein